MVSLWRANNSALEYQPLSWAIKQSENTPMRLSPDQVQAIRHAAQKVLGAGAQVSVFGSMALDNRRGGDIDLLFETDTPLENRAKVLCQLHGALTLALGDRKLDVLLKDANTPLTPVFEIAKRTGVPL